MSEIIMETEPVFVWEDAEAFLSHLKERGRKEETLKDYRGILRRFYEAMPADKRVTQDLLDAWPDTLLGRGYVPNTVNRYLSVINQFCAFCEWRALNPVPWVLFGKQMKYRLLTRKEYKRLLLTAKKQGQERLYLMIKTLVCTGMKFSEAARLEMNDVKKGSRLVSRQGELTMAVLPPALCGELLSYAQKNGIDRGYIFSTPNGLMNRHEAWVKLRRLCRDAEVPENKVSVQTLTMLYQETYSTLKKQMEPILQQNYSQLLEAEQEEIGWGLLQLAPPQQGESGKIQKVVSQ